MIQKISKRIVDGLAEGATTWDATVKGFGVRRQKGMGVSYVLRYRVGAGRGAPIRTVTIGAHGSPWTPETARQEAKRLLARVAQGHDPASERQGETVADLAARFLDEHVAPKRKERTAEEYRRLVALFILPTLGRLKINDVTRAHVARLHHKLRATPYQANRVLAVLSAMFGLAETWGWRAEGTNPCKRIERFKEARRERMLSAEELARLGETLDGVPRVSPYALAAIRLLILTGARLNEILTLQWSWIDFERAEARLPDSKTGAKTLHLPPPALTVLAGLPRIAGNPFVIVGERQGQHLVNLQQPWRRVREAAGLHDLRLHDLRHAFASIGAASGLGLPILGRILGHALPQTTARYAHLQGDPVKQAADAIARTIAEAMTPPATSATVVSLPRKQG